LTVMGFLSECAELSGYNSFNYECLMHFSIMNGYSGLIIISLFNLIAIMQQMM